MSTDERPDEAPAQTPAAAPLTSPLPFGRYRLLERIGAGGMAEIWRAVAVGEQGFERTVAIKRIREEVGEVADIGRLFADEARLSALLDHPNIVQVYDFGAVAGTYYIAMEYLKGRNLDQVLFALRRSHQRLGPALAVFIAREVARGLAYAHSLRDDKGRPYEIVHRDVSPANMMLLQAGAVKLLDFGIARVTSELRLAVTQGRALRGKCPYLAPEQITGGTVDGRSDIFALGVVLWEMLTGHRLFGGESDLDTISSVLNGEIPPPSSLAAEVPPALDRIVMTALARDQQRRYRSADAIATDLDDVMRALPSRHGDLPALLARLFGPPPAERVEGAPDPMVTAPRFSLELHVPPAASAPASPHEITRRELPQPPEAAPLARPSPRQQGWPITGDASANDHGDATAEPRPYDSELVTAVELPNRLLTGRGRPAVRQASGRWSLMAVLGALVVTELLGSLLYKTFEGLRDAGPARGGHQAAFLAPDTSSRGCGPAGAPARPLPAQAPAPSPNVCRLPARQAPVVAAGNQGPRPPARTKPTGRARNRRMAARTLAARKAAARTIARRSPPRAAELHVDPFAE